MITLSRFFDSVTTMFFILWMLLSLFEKSGLALISITVVVLCIFCQLVLQAMIFYRVTSHQMKQ